MPEKNKILHDDKPLEEYLHLFDNLRVPAIHSKEEAWNKLNFAINRKIKSSYTRSLIYQTLSFAAGIALIIGVFQWTGSREIKKVCLPGQMLTFYLPDSSQITLNASSTIHYKANKWNKNRLVYLNGEAFFRVKKGSKFQVITPNGKVGVLGTTFNVFARGIQLKVYCETGRVTVSSKNTVLLTPGMKTQAEKGKVLQVEKVQENHERTWLQGEFWYKNALLDEVVAEIERQFNVKINYQNDSTRYYSGYFNRKSLSQTLTEVFGPMQLKYSVIYHPKNN